MSSPLPQVRLGYFEALRERIGSDERFPKWLLAVCLVGLFSTTFPVTILTVAIVPIAHNLHSQPTTIAWVTTAPMLASAVATPIVGRLGDLRGHRQVYLIGLVIAGAFAVLTAFSWNASVLITSRTLSQLGAATTIPATYAMFFRTLPPERRLRSASLATGVLAGSATIGLIIGGPLIDFFGWRPIFIIQAVLSAIAFLAAFVVLQRSSTPRLSIPLDYAGAVTLALTTLSLTFGINQLAVAGWTPLVVASFVTFPFALIALIVIERRASHPLLPLQVLRTRNARIVMSVSFLTGAGWMGSFVTTPLMLQSGLGYSTGIASISTAPRGASMFAVSGAVAGNTANRFGVRRVTLVTGFALAAVTLLMAFATDMKSLVIIIISLALIGLIYGLLQPGLVTTMANSVPETDIGVATSLQQTTNSIGAVVGIALCTALAANSKTLGPYVLVYVISAALIFVAALGSFLLRDATSRAPSVVGVSAAVELEAAEQAAG